MLILLALLGSACTPSADPPERTVRISVDAETASNIRVGGLTHAPLVLEIEPGDFDSAGVISRRADSLRAPVSAPWFTAAGRVTDITVEGPVAKPLTLSFNSGEHHRADIPIIWRHEPRAGWYPIAAGAAGGTAIAERSRFSPHVPGWADVTRWFEGRRADLTRWFRGRTDPPECRSAAPKWATLTAPAVDILLACAATNDDGATERVEVQVKNNRAMTQEITIPPGVAYADVEGQPEVVRKLVRTIAGGRDIVLLPPGKRLSVGFTRPQTDREVQLVPRSSTLALASDLVVYLADLAESLGAASQVVAMLLLQNCVGVDGTVLQGALPTALDGIATFIREMSRCALEAATRLGQAVALAEQYVSLTENVPLIIVQSDRAFSKKVEQVAGKIHLAAQLVKAADLIRAAPIVWEGVAELAGREFAGANDPAAVQLSLAAPSPPATKVVTIRPVTAGGRPASGWSVRPTATDVKCGYPSTAAVADDIHSCSPTAAAADVCWPDAVRTSVLCLRDPWSKTLYEHTASGADIHVRASADPYPLGIELADGIRCRLRNGGSWSGRADDDTLVGFYSCGSDEVIVWGPQGGSAFDKTTEAWTVLLGTPTSPLRTLRVVTAYVVATAQ